MHDYDFLEFRLLKYVLAVANAEHFTEAANALHLAQSSLSQQIMNFEERYDIKIFRRDRDGYAGLTEIGEVVVSAAKEFLHLRRDLVDILATYKEGATSALRLGCTSLVEKASLNELLRLIKLLCPSCHVEVEFDSIASLEERVRSDDLDAAVVTLPLVNGSDLSAVVLEKEKLLVCMRADDELAQFDSVPSHKLNHKLGVFEYPEVHPQAYARLVQMLTDFGITPKQCRPTQNREHVQFLVERGECYALVRQNRHLLNGLTTRPIHCANWTIDTALISRPIQHHSVLALLLRELRRQVWKLGNENTPKGTLLSMPERASERKKPVKNETRHHTSRRRTVR
jgi:DNA-binding transcriptional LysR family regulator